MAQVEAKIVIVFCIFLFVGIVFWRACAIIAKHIEQENYERQRMFLLLAEELDRMDKIIKQNEAEKTQGLIQPYKDIWQLRN